MGCSVNGAIELSMCGRYENLIPRDAYKWVFRPERMPQNNFPPPDNVAPIDQIPNSRGPSRDGERELVMARWGMVPWWSNSCPRFRTSTPDARR